MQLESIYRSAPVVSNICVHADPMRAKPIAIIVPVEGVLNDLLQSLNYRKGDSVDLADSAEAQRLVLHQLQEKAREYNLASMETVEAVVLSSLNEWNPLNVSIL